ncbi:MAG: hypothetical protein M1818_003186 [Claussenomyces sp. TS43310]|nr:MAG: hypothetical protein M1818_003186 [Claussenomyces sp. TS43310]
MADDTRDPTAGANTANPDHVLGTAAPAAKKHPKGIILGKDGKPCRTCNSLADMMGSSRRTAKHSAGATNSSSVAKSDPECPPDVVALGRSSWTLLHSISATYPERPTAAEERDLTRFMTLFGRLYPCWVCAEDFQAYMEREKIRAGSRDEFGRWLCEAHNEVNVKLGKKTFDCGKWQERWRTGWKDGSCD